VYSICYDDQLICGSPDKNELNVNDSEANLEMKIMKDCDPVEISKQEIEEVMEDMPQGIVIPMNPKMFEELLLPINRRGV